MNYSTLENLAEAVADNQDRAWSEAELSDPHAQAMLHLQALSKLFRAQTVDGEQPQGDVLIQWRHLQARQEIGAGSFGKVYRAYDPFLRREVALKLAHRSSGESLTNRNFTAEARRMARLRHPNILAIHGADEDQGQVGIWCDLLNGKTLEAILSHTPVLSSSDVIAIALPLSHALRELHSKHLTHGDFKPANIMIQTDGTPVLMDFGAARDVLSGAATFGTPLVMAPEQLLAGACSSAIDIYAFSSVLYRQLVGRYPRVASNFDELVAMHRERVPIDMRPVPRAFRALISRGLQHDQARRGDAAQLHADLLHIQNAPQRRRKQWAVASIFAALSIGLTASIYGLLQARAGEQRAQQAQANAEQTLTFVEEMLAAPMEAKQGSQVKVIDVLDEATRRLDYAPRADEVEQARLRHVIAKTYRSLEQYTAAEIQLEKALALYKKHPEQLESQAVTLITLGLVNEATENYDSAEAQYRRAQQLLHNLDGATQRLTIETQFNLADLAAARGDHQSALPAMEQALLNAKSLPDDYFLAARIQGNLSHLYMYAGKLSDAEKMARDSLQWWQQHKGVSHADTIGAMSQLANVLSNQGKGSEAENLLTQALQKLAQIAPESISRKAALQSNLTIALYAQGKLDQALALMYEIRSDAQKAGAGDTLQSQLTGNIAAVLAELGEYDKALQEGRDAAAIARRAFGDTAANTLMLESNVAEFLLRANQPAQALLHARKIQKQLIATLGDAHQFTLFINEMIGAALLRTDQLEQAGEVLRKNILAKQALYGESNSAVLDSQTYLLELLIASEQFEQARSLGTQLLQARSQEDPPLSHKVEQIQKLQALIPEPAPQ